MNFEAILTVVAVVSLLLTAAGAIGGQYRINRTDRSVKITKEIAEAWEAKAQQQESQIADMKQLAAEREQETTAALAAKDTEIAELRARVQVLQDLVTGKSAIEDLAIRLDTRLTELFSEINVVRGDVRKLAGTGSPGP